MFSSKAIFNKALAVGITATAIITGCNHPVQKVTYYETHDNCPTMRILDTAMAAGKYAWKDDDEYDLALALRVHHTCAIEMAEYELRHGSNDAMKDIAKALLENEQAELAKVDSFLTGYKVTGATTSVYGEVKLAINKMHQTAEIQFINDNEDHDFAILLLPQRQCGIDIADIIYHTSQSPFLKELANSIDLKESTQVELLQLWLLKNKAR